MNLIGVITGEYEGNKYAKIILSEKLTRPGCFGVNAVVSKIKYDLATSEVIPNFDLYKDQEVYLAYDRYGKVIDIHLI